MKNPEEFRSPWWAINAHVHTVISSQFGEVKNVDVARLEISTPDDDFLEIDVLHSFPDAPVVALFHGLEGSSERFYIRNLMFDLRQSGLNTVALNFRSCGHKLNRQPRFYHSGETADYQTLFEWISQKYPSSSIYATGFSLGGNALIKYLGERGTEHRVKKAVAVSPPYDLGLGSKNLHHGFNRVYEYRFLRTLSKKLTQKRTQFPQLPTFSGNSVYEFDDQVTAPIHGFKNADDYYERSSSKRFLSAVRTPLLLIHSQQDTLTPLEYAPFSEINKNAHIETCFTKEGGHVGFISSPANWLNRTIIHWLKN